jgi:hypothetical protein
MKPSRQVPLSVGLLAFAITIGMLFHWRPGDILFTISVFLMGVVMVILSFREAGWRRRIRHLPKKERQQELAQLTPQQKKDVYESKKGTQG